MDFRAKESSWQAKASNMFKKGAGPSPTSFNSNQQENVTKYKNAVHKKIKIWWTKTTLENYVAQHIVPRGLRIHIFPTFDLDDISLKERWIKAANTCSLEFLNIIIENNARTLKNVEAEIDSLQKGLQQELKAESFQEMINKLDKDIEKWEGAISLNKQKKYERDWVDFETNKIFKWQNMKPIRRNVSRSSSITSNSSISEGGEPSHNVYNGPRTRQFSKKGPPQGNHNRREDTVKVINLSAHILTSAQERVLQRGLNFSPSSTLDTFTTVKDLHLFARKLILKKLHHKGNVGGLEVEDGEQQALEALISLLEEDTTNTTLPDGHLSTTVFRKSTATNSLLHATSQHPKSTTNSIPIGQYLRIKRICSEEDQFETQAKTLRDRFRDRGYNRRAIQKGYWRAKNTPRQQLLHKNSVTPVQTEQDMQLTCIHWLLTIAVLVWGKGRRISYEDTTSKMLFPEDKRTKGEGGGLSISPHVVYMGVVKKPSGEARIILNLKNLNQHIFYRRFKMEWVKSTIPLIGRGFFMATIDLKDAYFHVPIHP
ncbi:uncharacterized protein [Ranitomeya imitator]|uniref:uncharacterized protein n=1 Tax=Ranitomeya imitator TaxID=111125 RepID=UPI0037E85CC6